MSWKLLAGWRTSNILMDLLRWMCPSRIFDLCSLSSFHLLGCHSQRWLLPFGDGKKFASAPIFFVYPFPSFSVHFLMFHCEVCNTSINIRQFAPMAPQLLTGCSSSNRSTRERRCLIIVGTERRPVSGWAKREPTITNLYIDQRSFLRCLSSCMPQIDSNSFVGST